MPNYRSIVNALQKSYSDADEVIIVKPNGKTVFNTKKFNVGSDMKRVIATWQSGRGHFVEVGGNRYSILQCAPERFIATDNKRGSKGHLIGATTPNKSLYVLAHVKPKAKGWFHHAYPVVARAAAKIQDKSFGPSLESGINVKSGAIQGRQENYSSNTNSGYSTSYTSLISSIDSALETEVRSFLQWINEPTGLPAYIEQAIQQNNQSILSKLNDIYQELYDICR
ncbi:MAG: hypothetical protein ACFFAS_06010 [Promethearchaeota archaeon]